MVVCVEVCKQTIIFRREHDAWAKDEIEDGGGGEKLLAIVLCSLLSP